MKSNSTVHCQAECNGSSIPIHRTAEGYLVRYRDGKHRRSRVFEKDTQAVEFAKFLARRHFWSQFAAKHAPCLATPASGAFPLCPATRVSSAVEVYLRDAITGLSPRMVSLTAKTLPGLLASSRAVTLMDLDAPWLAAAKQRSHATRTSQTLRYRMLYRFLGWLSGQPLDPVRPAVQCKRVLSFAQAQALLAACPDDTARRYVALALFAGLRGSEIESLRWSDIIANDRILVRSAGKGAERLIPLRPNLGHWLKRSAPEAGLVVRAAAAVRRGIAATMRRLGLNGGPHVLRQTWLLCTVVLEGIYAACSAGGVAMQPHHRKVIFLPLSQGEAERIMKITPAESPPPALGSHFLPPPPVSPESSTAGTHREASG